MTRRITSDLRGLDEVNASLRDTTSNSGIMNHQLRDSEEITSHASHRLLTIARR